MSPRARALAIPEICILISEPLDRRSLGRLARTSHHWHAIAGEILWKSRLRGLKPLLALMPAGAYQWDFSRVVCNGRIMSGIDIRFRLDPDELRAVLKRSSIVLEITFDHRDCVVDMAIYGRLTRLVGGLGPLFPALRSVSITMPKRYKANFVPRLPPALAAFCIGSMSLSLHIRRLLSAFPHVTTAFVVRASTVPCFSPNPNSLHLLGVSITTLLHIMDPAAPWGLGKLDVSLPSNATRRELRDLVTAIVDRCASLSHLKIGLDFDQPGRWIITRRLFTKLSHLQRLTHLDIEAPMRSHMSDDDWKAAVQPWPLLERLRIVPRTPRPCAYPSLSRRPYPTPSSTIQVVFDIATACPRLVTLGLPGIDCTRVSCWEPPRRSSPLFSPLSSLCIFESPVIDHGSLGRLLS
ncbi:hypothetical protein K525DRAFT_246128, partial [Schizophyllum commune Loenen D]